jgi:hypothetical protein
MKVSGQLHALSALSTRKQPVVPTEQEVSELRISPGRCGVEKNILLPQGMEIRPSSPYPVATFTEL